MQEKRKEEKLYYDDTKNMNQANIAFSDSKDLPDIPVIFVKGWAIMGWDCVGKDCMGIIMLASNVALCEDVLVAADVGAAAKSP